MMVTAENKLKKALAAIISAANEVGEPIHWKVRDAINQGNELLRELEAEGQDDAVPR